MMNDKCMYCNADILYRETDALIKCVHCGHTLRVAGFLTEQVKYQKALEEKERVETELKAAEAEREAAETRLHEVISGLDAIEGGVGEVTRALVDGQSDTQGKLDALADLSEKILLAQQDETRKDALVAEISGRVLTLQTSMDEKLRLINEYNAWSKDEHREEIDRLQALQSAAEAMKESQASIGERLNAIHEGAEKVEAELDGFRREYREDKQRKLEAMYRQASDYQHDRRFEEAENAYRQILLLGEEDPEIYWRILLCHYGVEYQSSGDDYVPTVFYPDLTDPEEMSDRRRLMECAVDEAERAHYEGELARIDAILDKYREYIHDNQYDVFISVKQADEIGRATLDSDKAAELYTLLKSWGLRVFNSRFSLKSVAGQEFEPYIVAALTSARVMIVVGANGSYMNAPWVRNEWIRFSWLQKNEIRQQGKTDRLLFCYLAGGMRPSDIPRGLNPDLQHVVEGVTAESTLREIMDRAIPRQPREEPVRQSAPAEAAPGDAELSIGSEVTFGRLAAQKSGDTMAIDWYVIGRENGYVLLLSKDMLFGLEYMSALEDDVPWENSLICDRLNHDSWVEDQYGAVGFGFTPAEASCVGRGDGPYDRMFILDRQGVEAMRMNPALKNALPTRFAKFGGGVRSFMMDRSSWWIRDTAQSDPKRKLLVNKRGDVNEIGGKVKGEWWGVRPCVWVREEGLKPGGAFFASPAEVSVPSAERKEAPPKDPYALGSIVVFGNMMRGKYGEKTQPIEWYVIKKDNNYAMMLSKEILNCASFGSRKCDWGDSNVYNMLNERSELKNMGWHFSASEEARIGRSGGTLSHYFDSEEEAERSNAEKHKVLNNRIFILNREEVERIQRDPELSHVLPTTFTKFWNFAHFSAVANKRCWWLRDRVRDEPRKRLLVDENGSILEGGAPVSSQIGIRPAIWIKIF